LKLIASHSRKARLLAASVILLASAVAFAQTPPAKSTHTASVHGHVSEATGNPAVDVFVFLEHDTENPGTDGALTHGVETQKVHTSGKGAFNIPSLDAGSYTIYAQTVSGVRTPRSHMTLKAGETKTVNLAFRPDQSPDETSAKEAPDFYDEPQFTVAGVTEASNSGGHGIENIKRASEALVKATGSLGDSPSGQPTPASTEPKPATNQALESQRTEIRTRIAADEKAQSASDSDQNQSLSRQPSSHQPNSRQPKAKKPAAPLTSLEQADLHHQLAQLDETLGDPLEAVNEYQRTEELAPNEAHCFDWATELLTHRAFEPATEIFEQGHRHYPQSMRMLLGLGVAWYARGDDDQAAQYFRSASDLAPSDPTPYMFLGRMESAETMPTEETVTYFARFSRLVPENAWANYYYAAGLWKRSLSEGPIDDATFKQVETLLQRALQLDPKFAEAHLQLGTLYGAREEYAQAIAEFQKAIAINADLAEAHYRLALAYRRTGNDAGAETEMRIHDDLLAKAKEDAERRRKSIQQFVILLKD
jgi:tetratricopeptide (TPR) repeat protein